MCFPKTSSIAWVNSTGYRCSTHPPKPCFSFAGHLQGENFAHPIHLRCSTQGIKAPVSHWRDRVHVGFGSSWEYTTPLDFWNHPSPTTGRHLVVDFCWNFVERYWVQLFMFFEKIEDEDKDDLFMVHALWNSLKPIFFRDGETFFTWKFLQESNLGVLDVVNPMDVFSRFMNSGLLVKNSPTSSNQVGFMEIWSGISDLQGALKAEDSPSSSNGIQFLGTNCWFLAEC